MQTSKEEEKVGEGDLEDFDDNASTVFSGDRTGGAHGARTGVLSGWTLRGRGRGARRKSSFSCRLQGGVLG